MTTPRRSSDFISRLRGWLRPRSSGERIGIDGGQSVAGPATVRIAYQGRLDDEALSDPDICLAYPSQRYPTDAETPQEDIARILETLRAMRMADKNIYLRIASITANGFCDDAALSRKINGLSCTRRSRMGTPGGTGFLPR